MKSRKIYFAAVFALLAVAFSISLFPVDAAAQERDGIVKELILERIEKIVQDDRDVSFEQVAKFLEVDAATAKRLDAATKLLTKYEESLVTVFIGRVEDDGGIAKKDFDEYLEALGLQDPTRR